MTLSVDEVSRISRAVVQGYRDDLHLLNVASTQGGGERVELLVAIAGCLRDPCVLLVNVSRSDRVAFESEIRTELRAALARQTAT